MTSPQLTADDELDAIVNGLYCRGLNDGDPDRYRPNHTELTRKQAKAAIVSWADKRALRREMMAPLSVIGSFKEWLAMGLSLQEICLKMDEKETAIRAAITIKSRIEKERG